MTPIILSFKCGGYDNDSPWINKDDLVVTIEVNRIGETFTLNGLRQYRLEIEDIGEDCVDIAVTASPLEGNSDADTECWKENVNRLQKSYHSCTFKYTRKGERKPVLRNAHITIEWDHSGEDMFDLAEQALEKGFWREAYNFYQKAKHSETSREHRFRLLYNIALEAEKTVTPKDLKPSFDFTKPFCFIIIDDLVGELKLGDPIREEVIRTYVRYLRSGMKGYVDESEAKLWEKKIDFLSRIVVSGYDGPVDDEGRPHGHGTQHLTDGDKKYKYEGDFEHGQRHGDGELLVSSSIPNTLTESEYYMQGDYDAAGRQISHPPSGSYKPYIQAWCIVYSGHWENDKPLCID